MVLEYLKKFLQKKKRCSHKFQVVFKLTFQNKYQNYNMKWAHHQVKVQSLIKNSAKFLFSLNTCAVNRDFWRMKIDSDSYGIAYLRDYVFIVLSYSDKIKINQ